MYVFSNQKKAGSYFMNVSAFMISTNKKRAIEGKDLVRNQTNNNNNRDDCLGSAF